ncbi:MAG TPA: NAD(P)-dependent oxidoreductase [Deltaproteobacteria bacterium]|nr:NAD(P)-dependent oxidoreductase [Deltaproteobacteria bacterium]
MNRVFIVGCGYIGLRVARLWEDEGASVSALARSPESARPLEERGIAPVQGDLDEPATLVGLPIKGTWAYYLAPPPERGDADPRMRAFLDRIPPGEEPEKIVSMSTTAVYGDLHGEWATEETPPAPATARGRRRLDAERAVLSWGRQRGISVVILRVAGIYGPGRLPLDKVRKRTPVLAGSESPCSNRIHADDLARVCVAAAKRGRGGAVYNVSDGQPGTISQYYCAVADRLGVPRPPEVTMSEARRVMSEAMLSYLSESKRVDNRKMREELGVELLYPDLDSGLAASFVDGG